MNKLQHYNPYMRIYSAGKIWHSPDFRDLRDNMGYNITANWIDMGAQADGDERIWPHCLRDAANCDLLILYCGDENEEQRGAIVEAGHAMAAGKPVYAIGKCKTLMANEISDVAFTKDASWHWTRATTLKAGYREACFHFIKNYSVPQIGDLHYSLEPTQQEIAA